MTRVSALAGVVVLAVAGGCRADGPFARLRSPNPPPPPGYVEEAARYPRLAAFAQPRGFMLPGYEFPNGEGRPLLRASPYAFSAAMGVLTFLPNPLTAIGLGVPAGIRTAHVFLNGSPTPGRPLVTAGWIASPETVEALMYLRMRRRGEIPGVDYPTNPGLTPYNRPRFVPQDAVPQTQYYYPAEYYGP